MPWETCRWSVEREVLESHLSGLDRTNETKRTTLKRIRSLFKWLRETRQIPENPCDGWKAPTAVSKVIGVMPIENGRKPFSEVPRSPHGTEILGRLALEAFAGMRHETAAQLPGNAIDFEHGIVTVPAAIDKKRNAQFTEHVPNNLLVWFKWWKPKHGIWEDLRTVTLKALRSQSLRSPIPNVLRHPAASYHIAMTGDAGKTAAMLTHSNLRMLWSNYRGKGGGKANGEAWFRILPPTT